MRTPTTRVRVAAGRLAHRAGMDPDQAAAAVVAGAGMLGTWHDPVLALERPLCGPCALELGAAGPAPRFLRVAHEGACAHCDAREAYDAFAAAEAARRQDSRPAALRRTEVQKMCTDRGCAA